MSEQDFLQCFDSHNPLVYSYIFFRTGRRVEVAEDLAQDVFIKAWQARASYDSEKAQVKTWLMRIARNLVIDYYRKQQYRRTEDLNHAEEILDENEELRIEKEILKEDLIKFIDSMNEYDAELLHLRFVNELELEEIAEIIEKNVNATKTAIHRALQKLKLIVNTNAYA